MIRSILCWLGFHDWMYMTEDELLNTKSILVLGHRTCKQCKIEQEENILSGWRRVK